MAILGFGDLHARLVAYLRDRIRNGNITERRLARITGVSQPHIHHVLHGHRRFSMEMADQVLQALRNDLLDFLEPDDIAQWKSRQ
jgi:transcriptional regulator with XRE-family HTH domain